MRKIFFTGMTLLLSLVLFSCVTTINFTVNFDSNGGTPVSSIVSDGQSNITIPPNPTKEGYIFGGWFWDNDTFSQPFTANSLLDSPLTESFTVYARWLLETDTPSIGTLRVTFNSMGGTEIASVNVLRNSTISIPIVSKLGYTLDGWYTSLNQGVTLDEKWSFTNSLVTSNITLYAKWTLDTYTISYVMDGGVTTINNPIQYTVETNSITLESPLKTGYTFMGWFDNALFTGDAITTIESGTVGHLTFYGKWAINEYTISFNVDGGSQIEPITQTYNTIVTKPEDPIKEGYNFVGWFTDVALTQGYIFNAELTNDIMLYAKWAINTYTINYVMDGGTNSSINPIEYTFGSENIILETPSKTGYTFLGWYDNELFTGESRATIETATLSNLIYYAKWIINEYTITFNVDGGSQIEPITQAYNTTVTKPEDPIKEAHTFIGWFTDVELTKVYIFEDKLVKDIELYAKWYNTVELIETMEIMVLDGSNITYSSTANMYVVAGDISLPLVVNGLDIFWESSNPIVISNLGNVNRQEVNVTLILKAIFSMSNHALTKEFEVLVLNSIEAVPIPIISGYNASPIVYIGSETYDPLTGVTAMDDFDGDITESIVVLGTYDLTTPGQYTIHLRSTNSLGADDTVMIILTVRENIPLELTSDPITITLWHAMGTELTALMQKYANSFMALHPNVTVIIGESAGTYSTLKSNMINAITAGHYPNMVQGYPDHVAEYLNGKAVVPLDVYINNDIHGLHGADALEDIIQSYRDENSQYDIAGTFYSLPFNKSTEVMYYNKTVFDRLGLVPPTTWQELIAMAPTLRAEATRLNTVNFAPATYDNNSNAFITFTRQFGGAYTSYNHDTNRGQLLWSTNANTLTAMQFLKDNKDTIVLPQHWGQQYASTPFLTQQTYITFGSTAGVRYNIPGGLAAGLGDDFTVGIAPMPYNADRPNDRAVIQQGTNISLLNAGTAQQQLASWLFLKHVISTENTMDWAMNSGYLPVRTSAINHPTYQAFLAQPNNAVAHASRAAYDQSSYFFQDSAFVGSPSARAQVGLALQRIMLGDGNIQAALDEAFNNTLLPNPPEVDSDDNEYSEVLLNARDQLLLADVNDGVKTNINLPSSVGTEGVTVTWTSNRATIISIVGNFAIVERQAENEIVILTATLTKGTESVTKQFEIVVLAAELAIEVDNIAAAIALGQDKFVSISAITILGITGDGVVFHDSSGILFAYLGLRRTDLVVGNVYDVQGLIDRFFGGWQLGNTADKPIIFTPSDGAKTEMVPIEVNSVTEMIANHHVPEPTNPNINYAYYRLTAKIRIQSSTDNYGTVFVDPDYDGPDLPTAPNSDHTDDGVIVYYHSNKAAFDALDGQIVTFNVLLYGYRSDRNIFSTLFLEDLEDIQVDS